jgi:hypothetical protein
MRDVPQTPAASALAPFGASEAAVRAELLDAMSGAGDFVLRFLVSIVRGYDRVSAAARGPATAAAFGWFKVFVSSPAFASAYTKFRDEHKPAGVAAASSIDDEVKKQIADMIARTEESRQAVAALPPADRTKAIANIDQMIAMFRTPKYAADVKAGLEIQATAKAESSRKAAADWEAHWPADPKALVRKHLEHFFAATANIDYETQTIFVKGARGETIGFLRPGANALPPETVFSVVAGKPAMDAARGVVDAWMKELK